LPTRRSSDLKTPPPKGPPGPSRSTWPKPPNAAADKPAWRSRRRTRKALSGGARRRASCGFCTSDESGNGEWGLGNGKRPFPHSPFPFPLLGGLLEVDPDRQRPVAQRHEGQRTGEEQGFQFRETPAGEHDR